MRLKGHDEPAVEGHLGGGQHGGDFSRVMAVVVYQQHAVDLAVALETAFGARELSQGRLDGGELDSHF